MARMTKELKPKDNANENGTPQEADQTTEALGAESAAEFASKPQQPLWRRLLPYAIQVILPFVLYYIIMSTNGPLQQQAANDSEL